MFLPVTDEWKALQRQPSTRPHIKVEVDNFTAGADRPRWTRLYTGSEPDEYHGLAICTGVHTMVRIRIASNTLYRQVVANPSPTSDFSTWVSWRAGTRLCAIGRAGDGDELRVFAVDDVTPTQIFESVSTDRGASWSAFSLIETAAGAITHIAAGGSDSIPGGDFLLLYAVGATLYKKKRTAGAWGATGAWPNSVNSITGVAVAHYQDWSIVLTGTEATTLNPTVWQLAYGTGYNQAADTWSGLTPIFPASQGSNLVFDSPALADARGRLWLSFGENYTGAGGYNRNWVTHNVNDFHVAAWTEPFPFNQTNNNHLALGWFTPTLPEALEGPILWATTPYGVWSADLTRNVLSLTDDLLEYEIREEPWSVYGTLDLDNATGKYNSPGADALVDLRLASRLRIEFGWYKAGVGPVHDIEPGSPAGYRELYILGWEHDVAPGRAVLRLRLGSPAALLDAARVRSSRQWAANTTDIWTIATSLTARAGVVLTNVGQSPQFTTLKPAFTLHPGESALEALKRLYHKLPDRIRSWRADRAYSIHPQASDASFYSYGGTLLEALESNHPIEALTVQTQAPNTNYVQALAGSALGEAVDWDSITDVFLRAAVDQDKLLTTEAEGDDRATATLRAAQIEAATGRLVARTNTLLELYDVIDITEPRAGLNAAKRRVMGITWIYQPKKGRYHQVLELGAV